MSSASDPYSASVRAVAHSLVFMNEDARNYRAHIQAAEQMTSALVVLGFSGRDWQDDVHALIHALVHVVDVEHDEPVAGGDSHVHPGRPERDGVRIRRRAEAAARPASGVLPCSGNTRQPRRV